MKCFVGCIKWVFILYVLIGVIGVTAEYPCTGLSIIIAIGLLVRAVRRKKTCASA